MQPFDRYAIYSDSQAYLRTQGTVWAAGVAALAASVTLATQKAPWVKQAAIAVGATATLVGYVNSKTLELADEAVADIRISESIQRQLRPFETASEAVEPARSTETLKVYDWTSILDDRDLYPFVLFLGLAGGGKTTCREYLMALSDATQVVVTPHHQPERFRAADYTVLSSRTSEVYYSGYEVPELTLCDYEGQQGLLSLGAVVDTSIFQVILSITAECRERQRLVASGVSVSSLETLDITFDEVPEIYGELKARGKEVLEAWQLFLRTAMMSARKYGIRCWFIGQSETIEGMGFKGFAELRDANLHVYFGASAIKAAARLKLPPEALEQMAAQTRPLLIAETPGIMPPLEVMRGAIAIKVLEKM